MNKELKAVTFDFGGVFSDSPFHAFRDYSEDGKLAHYWNTPYGSGSAYVERVSTEGWRVWVVDLNESALAEPA